MALSFLRVGMLGSRVRATAIKLIPGGLQAQSNASITSKAFKKHSDVKPFPYETVRYNFLRSLFDDTESRFDENSKIIIVEGNIAAGKTTLAKSLAEELDFLHFPEASMDMLYVDKSGFDLRSLDHLLPDLMKHYDIKTFYKNPSSPLSADFQYKMLQIRSEQYLDAMAHLLNTGQGVILERSAYSDFVFMETMYKFGFVNKEAMDVYNEMRKNIIREFLKPHLIIYLDAPIETLQSRIKQRNLPHEVNTNVLSKDYLKNIDDLYKTSYLRSIKEESELLIYDWTKFGEPEVVVEDIERIDFESQIEDIHEPKFGDWRMKHPREWDQIRYRCSSAEDQAIATNIHTVLRYNLPENIAGADAVVEYNDVVLKHAPQYDPGFDPKKGNSWLFRAEGNYREDISFARTR